MKFIPLFILFSVSSFSQNLSFIYQVKYKAMSAENNAVRPIEMILDIKDGLSIFRDSEDKKADSLSKFNKNRMTPMGVEHQFYVKKNLSNNEVNKIIYYLNINYALPIDEELKWKILSDQKMIGKYQSQKAELQYGGRKWVAWFTIELPFSDGPYIFNGLPGLIISIEDLKQDYVFNLIEVKKLGQFFDVKEKLISIDWKQYETLAKSHYNDPYNINSSRYVKLTDPAGKVMDIKDFIKTRQNYILSADNPVELNHKISY